MGQAGAAAAAEASEQLAANMEAKAAEEAKRRDSKLVGHKPTADVWGEAGEEALQLDQAKVQEALKRQEQVRITYDTWG